MTLDKAQIGDVVTRNRVFTESFVAGEEHTVQRVSGCGQYIWVGGHRHKVPTKYFNLVRRSSSVPTLPTAPFKTGDAVVYKHSVKTMVREVHDVKFTYNRWYVRFVDNMGQGFVEAKCYKLVDSTPAPPELTDFVTKPNDLVRFKVGDVVTQQTGSGSREFEVGDVSLNGLQFRATGHYTMGWMDVKDFTLKENVTINRDIVAGLILQGSEVQYRNMGEWLDVNPNTLTVSMIKRLDFRIKPCTIDFYGTAVPAPVDPNKTSVKTLYGISLNNNKVYPCALGTARVNKSKGFGLYWEIEAEAQQVFDVLMKPLRGATK